MERFDDVKTLIGVVLWSAQICRSNLRLRLNSKDWLWEVMNSHMTVQNSLNIAICSSDPPWTSHTAPQDQKLHIH
eukprot:7163122-Karenia_brevis.AAC.1